MPASSTELPNLESSLSPHMALVDSSTAQLGIGHVYHKRLRPVIHQFQYPTYFLLLPLRSIYQANTVIAPKQVLGDLSHNRRGLISFYDCDHGDGRENALQWLDEVLVQHGIDDASGEVWLHCYPRVMGYAFKPVSFWYCHHISGALRAILVEVNNTFGERHCYLLTGEALKENAELEAVKCFHVSPFCRTQGQYRFRFQHTANTTWVHVHYHDQQGPLLLTHVQGELAPTTRERLNYAFWRVPLMTWGVIWRIHWQAFLLWRKKVPFFRKPKSPASFIS